MAMFAEAAKLFDLSDIPEPEILDANSVPALRWGILGAGDIAEVFAETIQKNTNQKMRPLTHLSFLKRLKLQNTRH